MRLLHVIASADPTTGGPVEGILQLDRVLSSLGCTTEVVSADDRNAPFLCNFPIKIHALGKLTQPVAQGWRRLSRYGYTSDFVPWLREHASDYDYIIVNGLWNYAALASVIAFRNMDRPYYVFPHGMMDPWFKMKYPFKHLLKQAHWLFCEGPLLNNAEAVLFTAEDEHARAKDVFLGYTYRAIVVGYGTASPPVHSSAIAEAFYSKMPELRARRFFLFLGRIHPKKGCDLLIESFAKVARENPDIDLAMAGPDHDNWIPELQNRATALGVTNRIHWIGILKGDAKWGAFHCCEAFVLPSHQENFGVVVAEALACAKPVLISDKVNIWREVKNGQAGLVSSDDLPGTEDNLRRYLEMSASQQFEMGIKAKALFTEQFDVELSARRLYNLFQNYSAK